MLNNTSWTDYCYVIIVAYSIYYVITGFYYYKYELEQLLSGRRLPLPVPGKQSVGKETSSLYGESIIDEVCAFCDQYAQHDFIKSELLDGLKLLLAKHAYIKAAGQARHLDAAIQGELDKRCSIHLSQAEMELLWEG